MRLKVVKMFTMLGVLLALPQQVQAVIPAQERAALIALYNATNGANWINNEGWLGAPGTECSWHGVNCSLGELNVIQISLLNNQLSGFIPPELAQLSQLSWLDLGINQLSGSIPPELGQLSLLSWLYLFNNQLSGSIPPELGQLSQLVMLDLEINQLNSSIPPELGQLLQLDFLFLENNQLSGEIPSELGQLSQLTELELSNNQLRGEIPFELTGLTNLEYGELTLAENYLTASDPVLMEFLDQKSLDWRNQKDASTIPPAEPELASGSFAEPSDTPEQAVPILVNDTPQYQLLDDRGGDDWFEFYAEQGTRYTLQVPVDSIGSAIHPGLELYDTSGNLLETANYAGSAAETQIVWRATATELFRLRVFDQGLAARKASPASDYAYQLRVFLTDAPQQGLIKGFVRDACQQIGINKAAVSAWAGGSLRDSSFTHKTGEFGIPIDPGAYDVKSSASEYQEKQRNVSVAQVQTSRADFDLSPQSSCEQMTQTLDPVLQSQQAVATYDEQTGLLIIKDVWAKGYTYYAELQDIGGYRFQLMDAIPLSGTIHAPTGAYSFDTLQADFPSVYAFGKTFTVQMKNDGNWLFDLTHASEAE